MLAWYDEVTGGLQTNGMIDQFGPRQVWQDAADAEADGDDLSWYRVQCIDPRDYKKYNPGVVEGGIDPVTGSPVTWVTFNYRAFPAGAAVPAPMVAPAELARVAHDLMVIPEPAVDRNPKLAGAGAPTLVGLPTFFWVTNNDQVGTRTIVAEVGNVWAKVVATAGGLSLSSPAGGADCTPQQATAAYGAKVVAATACTIEFDHASTAYPSGYRVDLTTDWTAAWTGSGTTGGDLDPRQRQAFTLVPVAEVQNVVTR
jgi:hypothetical protein